MNRRLQQLTMTEESKHINEVAEATTPHATEPEVDQEQGMTMEDMESLYGETMQHFREGEVVRGTVVELAGDYVLVDIGYKSEGAIPVDEFPSRNDVQVGEEFDVFIEEPEDEDGMPVLSKIKADKIKNWTHIQRIYDEDGVIEGRIVRRVKGGLKVDIGIDAFMPASQLTWRPTSDLDRYIGESDGGQDHQAHEAAPQRGGEPPQAARGAACGREAASCLATIAIGQVIPGEVKNITDFGAFVDVGGIDGLLHVTDMSWGRVKHPSQVVSVGQTASR